MSDSARVGSTAASAGVLALAALCAQQFNMTYDTVGTQDTDIRGRK
jgi:hypothetical protein